MTKPTVERARRYVAEHFSNKTNSVWYFKFYFLISHLEKYYRSSVCVAGKAVGKPKSTRTLLDKMGLRDKERTPLRAGRSAAARCYYRALCSQCFATSRLQRLTGIDRRNFKSYTNLADGNDDSCVTREMTFARI